MTDTPYEDTDQRINGHDYETDTEAEIPSILDGPEGNGLYPWMNYAPTSYVDLYSTEDDDGRPVMGDLNA